LAPTLAPLVLLLQLGHAQSMSRDRERSEWGVPKWQHGVTITHMGVQAVLRREQAKQEAQGRNGA